MEFYIKKFFLLNFIIIVYSSVQEVNKTLIYKFSYSKDNIPSIPFKIGTPPQNINLQLNTLSYFTTVPSYNRDYTWTFFDQYSSMSIKISDDIVLNYLNNTIKAKIAYDNFYFNFDSISYLSEFGFLLTENDSKHNNTYTKGNLGLAPSLEVKDFSFLNMLTNKNVISEKNFRINFISDQMFIIGKIYKFDDQVNNSKFTFCHNGRSLIQNYISVYKTNYWSCNLSHIIYFNQESYFNHEGKESTSNNSILLYKEMNQINNTFNSGIQTNNPNDTSNKISIDNVTNNNQQRSQDNRNKRYFNTHSLFINKTAIFATSLNKILVPKRLQSEVMRRYFEQRSNKLNCDSLKSSETVTKIICNNVDNYTEFIANFNYSLTFVFNGYGYIINNTKLFSETPIFSKNYTFRIEFVDNLDDFIVGTPFLSNYDIAFDYERQIIGFIEGIRLNFTNFTSEIMNNRSSGGSNFWRNFFIILLVILLLLLLFFLYRRYQKRDQLSFYSKIDSNF